MPSLCFTLEQNNYRSTALSFHPYLCDTLRNQIPHLEKELHFPEDTSRSPEQAHLLAKALLLSARDCAADYLLFERMAYVRDTLPLFSRF